MRGKEGKAGRKTRSLSSRNSARQPLKDNCSGATGQVSPRGCTCARGGGYSAWMPGITQGLEVYRGENTVLNCKGAH